MKYLFLVVFYSLFSLIGFGQEDSVKLVLSKTIYGNFDAKEGFDKAYLYVPDKSMNATDCRCCISEIRFEGQEYVLKFMSDTGGPFENVGDLDGDGVDEIGHTRTWFETCWGTYEIYKNIGHKWVGIAVQEYRVCKDKKGIKARIKVLDNGNLLLEGHDIYGKVQYEEHVIYY